MRVSPMNDAFHRDVNKIYMPDEYEDCAICGNLVLWPQEPAERDKYNQICHKECLEGRSDNA